MGTAASDQGAHKGHRADPAYEPENVYWPKASYCMLPHDGFTREDMARAEQTKSLLNLASRSYEYMREGLSQTNCQAVCELMLPETQAMSVAITNDSTVLGFAGRYAEDFPSGSPIHTNATHAVLRNKRTQVFSGSRSMGVFGVKVIPASVVAPLIVRDEAVGTLKLYFESFKQIDETQMAIATGFADLLSTQLSVSELDRQIELTTKAELRALQAQINPHFLFNTINTIASFVRTDPMHARGLLREFAKFYRQTLENSGDLIPFSLELEQTQRYLSFVVARFGDNRVKAVFDTEDGLADIRVPSFIIQPIVENAINHGMSPGNTLQITVSAYSDAGGSVHVDISDNGVGMDDEKVAAVLDGSHVSEDGTGVALHNVDARLRTCYGKDAGLSIQSEPGVGTTVSLHISGALIHGPQISGIAGSSSGLEDLR